MKLSFVTDSRFTFYDGKYYNLNGSLGDAIWRRYLHVFSDITVYARVSHDLKPAHNAPTTEDTRVKIVELPYFVGPKEYLKKRKAISKLFEEQLITGVAYICRLPGKVGELAINVLKKRDINYCVEVVGDPFVSLSYRATHNVVSSLLRYPQCLSLKKAVKDAFAAQYVTEYTLQNRYPTKLGSFSIGVSDVIITKQQPPQQFKPRTPLKVLACGSLEQLYKSPDIAVRVIKKLSDEGIDCLLTWLGDGRFKSKMVALSESLGVNNRICFVGNVSKNEVGEYLQDTDIFLQISRTEGLPRALVEALSYGLPCIGTNVGGIPELVPNECVVPVDDVTSICEIIKKFLIDPSYTDRIKKQNYSRSLNFLPEILNKKREQFYAAVINSVK